MRAQDIMTKSIVSVRPSATVREIAQLMSDRHISGVVVTTEKDELLGIVTQSDLLHRVETGTERRRKWWLRFFIDQESEARDFLKSHGVKAADVMSRHVVSVRLGTELGEVADILDHHRIKRVPVIERGKVVGIVSRGDVVAVLSRIERKTEQNPLRNAELQKTIVDKMRMQSWLNSSFIGVTVDGGKVNLVGFIPTPDQRSALRVLLEEIDGVETIDDELNVGLPNMGY
ncbi:MAG: CBS domain-containing protein [Hyphomicrobiaceae bacterium]|nr:CBS domain-containing protein [Hyphomicrobiaceae bacterium]